MNRMKTLKLDIPLPVIHLFILFMVPFRAQLLDEIQ